MMDAYTVLAGSYDRLTRDVDYERWADYAQRHFAKQKCPVETVLELGCGTGSLTRLLARRGYAVTALDLSPDMLAVAEQKCRGLNARFLCQDMTKFGWIGPVDAVVSGLDSVNYVTKPRKLLKMFQSVHENLSPGGLFLFDVKTPAALEGADGTVYTGCNVENAAYGSSICAERTALVKAVSEGCRSFRRLAVVGNGQDYCWPCGACRQMLYEFAPELEVLVANGDHSFVKYSLCALLPQGFGPSSLGQ